MLTPAHGRIATGLTHRSATAGGMSSRGYLYVPRVRVAGPQAISSDDELNCPACCLDGGE